MKRTRIEFYQDAKGEHRWRIKAGNGRIIAAASEGFKRLAGAQRNLGKVGAAITRAREAIRLPESP